MSTKRKIVIIAMLLVASTAIGATLGTVAAGWTPKHGWPGYCAMVLIRRNIWIGTSLNDSFECTRLDWIVSPNSSSHGQYTPSAIKTVLSVSDFA